jgi:small subunit ribosomal protein S6
MYNTIEFTCLWGGLFQILVAGGAMYVEVFNRGVTPLSYSVQKVNRDGTKDTYGDGVYLLFTFFTKPESIGVLENQLRQDFSVIRHSVLKVEKQREEKKDKKDKKERRKAMEI